MKDSEIIVQNGEFYAIGDKYIPQP